MDMVEVGWRKAEDGGGEGGVRCFDENEAEESSSGGMLPRRAGDAGKTSERDGCLFLCGAQGTL